MAHETPGSERVAGGTSMGEKLVGEVPVNEAPTSEAPTSKIPAGEKPTMLTYIEQTPAQLRRNVERSGELTAALVDAFMQKPRRAVWLIACGSSANAAHCARFFMMKYLGCEVKIVTPATFSYGEHNLTSEDFALVISQSGCSTNSIAALDELRALGVPAVGLTGNVDSDFKDHADLVVDCGIGEETVGFVTKGVTTIAQFLMIFAIEAAARSGRIDARTRAALLDEMRACADRHEVVQRETWELYRRHKAAFTSMTVVNHCGFLQGYGIACEGALKFGETVQIPSFAYEGEEWIHGPELQLTPNYTVICIDDMGPGSRRIVDIYRAARTVTDRAFMVTNSERVDDDHAIRLPFEVGEPLLSPLYVLPFYQIIAHQATTDLHRWQKHPLFEERFSKAISTKTENIDKIMPY